MFNLINPKYKIAYKRSILSRILYFLSVFVVLWLFIFGTVIFSAIQFFAIQNNALAGSINAALAVREIEEAEELEADIAAINQLSRRISDIENVQPYEFFDVLTELALLMPAGTNLTRITFSRNSDSVTIEGHAEQRTQVIALEDALRASEFFGEVDAPLSNLLQPTNINFKFTLTSIQEG